MEILSLVLDPPMHAGVSCGKHVSALVWQFGVGACPQVALRLKEVEVSQLRNELDTIKEQLGEKSQVSTEEAMEKTVLKLKVLWWWFSVRLWHFHCWCIGDTAVFL